MQKQFIEKYHNEIFEKFGINYGLVFDLLEKYEENPDSISDEWKKYLEELLNGDLGQIRDSKPSTSQAKSYENRSGEQIKKEGAVAEKDNRNLELISGVGAKIIENMDTSLSIPTATSHRNISVKLLEENRRLINQHLQRIGERKLSFTHIVAFALVQALKKFPELNNSFIVSEGKPYLHRKESMNLGLAVDVVRKNGSRSLMVPNIKNAERLMGKQIKVFEWADEPKLFIKNMIPQAQKIEINKNKATVSLSNKDRGSVIGKGGSNINVIREFLERNSEVESLKVI